MSAAAENKVVLIVRTEREAALAAESGTRPVLWCTSRPVFEYCRGMKMDARLLHEDLIGDEFQAVNTWGYQKTIDFVDSFSGGKEKSLFFQSNFLYVQRAFIQALKYSRVLAKLVDEVSPLEIRIHDDGSSLLAISFSEYLKHFHPGVLSTCLPKLHEKQSATPKTAKEWAAIFLMPVINFINTRKLESFAKKGAKMLLASGGMHHLTALLEPLQTKHRYQIVYAEQEFNLEKLKYCQKNGMMHVFLPSSKRSLDNRLTEVRFKPGQLVYRGVDYSEMISAVLSRYLKTDAVRFTYDAEALSKLYAKGRFDAVLLDEDIALRRMMGVFSGKDYFVVSHGIPAGLSDDTAYKGRYYSGIIFASSKFEENEYDRLFYDMKKIQVSGVPRYDRLFSLKKTTPKPSAVKNILHCGASMKSSSFEDTYTLLGLTNFMCEYSERYLQDLLEILADRKDVLLKVKPHYAEEAEWIKRVPKHLSGRTNHEILSHKDDTFRLEAETDLLITVESSVVCEAIMLGKPVILLNYTKQGLFSQYEKHGLVEHVRTKEELRAAIQKCLYDEVYLKDLSERREKFGAYFGHLMDGRNSERAADLIARSRAA